MKRKPIAGACERYSNPHVKYRSRAVAQYNASLLRAKGATGVKAFRCERGGGGGCGFWHVGSEEEPLEPPSGPQ